ncbi:phosphotransferase family protein [Aspergillus lucknowensis]|uniref:Phosphotransferase family protein n=1 Tax=Aspergillus lucknowensis TaxID=176173 RepID=A0ABR4M4A0_9EURO
MQTRMCPDDVAWEQAEETSDNWLVQFLEVDILRPIADFVLIYHRGAATEFAILRKGSYNISLRLKYRNGATVIRLSQPGAVFFPEEKVVNEVAMMRFLADQTSIPVPFIIHSGTKKESPLQLSPFIIMDYIEHETKMYDALNIPGCPAEERGILDPNIAEDRLEMLYGQLADVLLQLSVPSLSHIGSLSQIDDFTWRVTQRPLSMNMNELVRLGDLPRSKLPDTTFNTSSSYLEALADLNIEHLIHQRNDAVESADDCRRKFVARKLFHKLAKNKQLTNPSLETGPFKIWCDDLRPANVLLNENMQIVGVVDWEFTYAAPAEFSYAPPWWLLIEKPEYWPKGIEDWTTVFDYRLKTFLKVMKNREDIAIQEGRLTEDQRLSGHMGQSWESGDFWIMYAVLHSFAFDTIYWRKIDPRFFGPTENPEEAWKERLSLLDEKEQYEMEQQVARKLEDMKTRALAWDPDEYTLAFHQQLKRRREEADEEKDKNNEVENRGNETEASGLSGADTISDKLAATRLSR